MKRLIVTDTKKVQPALQASKWQTLDLRLSADDLANDNVLVQCPDFHHRTVMVADMLSGSQIIQDFARQIILSVLGNKGTCYFKTYPTLRNEQYYECTDAEQAEIVRLFAIHKAEFIEKIMNGFIETIGVNSLFVGSKSITA